MNKVITINLNGVAYQLEEAGYEALRVYLDKAAASMAANPDKDEIIADIEQAIGDKFRVLLGTHKNVVTGKEVETVIKEMGPVETEASPADTAPGVTGADSKAGSAGTTGGSAAAGAGGKGRPRRLYRLQEGAMIWGICSGLEAFTNVNAMLFRILFVILTLSTGGLGALIYVALYFVVPQADTADERAEAQGPGPTTADFIKRAKEGYYEAMKNLPDREARREWKRRFKADMRKWKHSMKWEARNNWDQYCATHAPRLVRPNWFLLLLCGVLNVLFFLVVIYGIHGLAVHHAAYGLVMPPDMPLWVAILLLVAIVSLISVPVKIIESFAGGGWGCRRRHTGLGGALLFGAIAFGIAYWIYPDKTREFIDRIPPAVHQTTDAISEWWNKR